jgi:diaminohydroxyphosphoribosylaminopyrimidine deaminase / 5-amino-6-(5-phosphoribosylamino)uracil reductase
MKSAIALNQQLQSRADHGDGPVPMKPLKFVALCRFLFLTLSAAVDSHDTQRQMAALPSDAIESILADLKVWHRQASEDPTYRTRPFVLVSFAQSLDGQMAPWKDRVTRDATAANYPLSGHDSLVLTHAIRSIHDGIMIGGRTLAIDNPRLTNRLWKSDHPSEELHQPVPIALDTRLNNLREMQTRSTAIRARNLVVCCGEDAASELTSKWNVARMLRCQAREDRLDLLDVLQNLRTELDIRTLMVEGGSSLLTTLFINNLVDAICISISPKALCGGISPVMGLHPVDLRSLGPKFATLGSDCVLLSRWPASTVSSSKTPSI